MIDRLIVRIKRGDTPFFRFLKRNITGLVRSNLPVPRLAYPFFRALYFAHFGFLYAGRAAINYLYREPVFRSRCRSCGKRLHLWLGPRIRGRPEIEVGNDVNIFGAIEIFTDPSVSGARLIIKDGADLGHNLKIFVNREIVFEEHVNIASGCTFMDSDCWDTSRQPRSPQDCQPVRIGRGAWIGQNAFIMKGVTIGEGAVVGVASVVTADIPAYAVAVGNPARVVFKNRPPSARQDTAAPAL